jgi:hypothetical protein
VGGERYKRMEITFVKSIQNGVPVVIKNPWTLQVPDIQGAALASVIWIKAIACLS